MTTKQIAELSNDDLLAATARAANAERSAIADLLRLLMEVDRRRLYLGHGCASMFAYCTRALRLSEQAAYSRITAARAARRFPELVQALEIGDVSLSTIGLLAPHLDDRNGAELINLVGGKSTREAERILAERFPRPAVASLVRACSSSPATTSAKRDEPSLEFAVGTIRETGESSAPIAARGASAVPAKPARTIEPIGARRYVLRITIDEATHETLQKLRALMRHRVPSGDPAQIVGCALTALLEKVQQARFAKRRPPAKVARPLPNVDRAGFAPSASGDSARSHSAPAPSTSSRSARRCIPAAVRRAVWARDGGRCAFVGVVGRCNEAAFIEFHHVLPFARGGGSTIDNVELRCRSHNNHEATLFFGEAHMSVAKPNGQGGRAG